VNRHDAAGLSRATVITVEVHAGDVLYLPATWFHHVAQVNDAEGKVVAVNYWYDMQFGPIAAIQPFVEAMDRATGGEATDVVDVEDANEASQVSVHATSPKMLP
jgi:oxalate decarboxylase/phosphoglucose isomerase-like protein (cupin superfamily)